MAIATILKTERLNAYRIMWIMVLFDLPTETKQDKKNYTDFRKKMQKDGGLTEDDLKSAEAQIQKLTDKYVTDVDSQVESKEADIMRV